VIKPEILFLKQEDAIQAGLLDMKEIMNVTENMYKLLGENKVIQPNKVFLGMPDSINWTSFAMSMPAYISGENEVVGFKWAAESVYNATQKGMPYGIDVVLLSDPKTMYPKAIMDGTIITAMRTSAVAGICAKYCARKDSKIAALIGAGVIGRTMVMAICEAFPGIEEIRMVDLDRNKAEGLVNEFKGKHPVTAYTDAKSAIDGADIIVTQTTAREGFIPKAWITKNNATAIQMEAHAFNHDVWLGDGIKICDSWEQYMHIEGSVILELNRAGKLKKEDFIEIKDLATGKFAGRENDDQFVFCATYGMGTLDVAVANMLYMNAKAKGIGQKLVLWDNPLWI